jgi:hypothetical protein
MEHEITGHSRKVYKLWKNNDISPWKKIKEIGIEVLIIVFAVSFAAFIEREREHSTEQKEVKSFLLGIKVDLSKDIQEMQADEESYIGAAKAFKYLTSLPPGEKLNKDSLKKYQGYLLNSTGLVPNDGRYQGFKSSGKISTIENGELQNDILDLYQESIPSLISNTDIYTQRKTVLFNYIFDVMKRNPDGSNNLADVLITDKAHNIAGTLSYTTEVIERYEKVISKSKKIIAAIDHEYPQ